MCAQTRPKRASQFLSCCLRCKLDIDSALCHRDEPRRSTTGTRRLHRVLAASHFRTAKYGFTSSSTAATRRGRTLPPLRIKNAPRVDSTSERHARSLALSNPVSPQHFASIYERYSSLWDLGIGRIVNLAVALPCGYALLAWGWAIAGRFQRLFVTLGQGWLVAFVLPSTASGGCSSAGQPTYCGSILWCK